MRKPADPNCRQCKGSGTVEQKVYKVSGAGDTYRRELFGIDYIQCPCTLRPLPPSEEDPYLPPTAA